MTLIFGAGAYIMYQAPEIISDAAFEFLLAASLMKKMKSMESACWKGVKIFYVSHSG